MGALSDRRRTRQAKEQRGRCFYCSLPLRDDMTWEHLVARAHGGSDKISNMRITHSRCNGLVGVLPLRVKHALHDIGHGMGSDAFFLIAARLKPQSNLSPKGAELRRRPKRTPPEVLEATVLQLTGHLPETMRIAA